MIAGSFRRAARRWTQPETAMEVWSAPAATADIAEAKGGSN
jgi:hypothetical protein